MILVGKKIYEKSLRDREVYVIGIFKIDVLIAYETCVLIGGGRVGLLISDKCILMSMRNPLIIGSVFCRSLVGIGSKYPLILNYVKTRDLYVRKTHIGILEADKAVLGELCVIEELTRAREIVFTDPHTYIHKLDSVGEIVFTYDISNNLTISPKTTDYK